MFVSSAKSMKSKAFDPRNQSFHSGGRLSFLVVILSFLYFLAFITFGEFFLAILR